MLGKLSIRNAKRQAKDYIIYFITVAISVALMFSFNSIAVSEDIVELSSMMKAFSQSISIISFIIILVMAWLINYTMKFMLEKRSKEFGTYEILGIEKKDISNMFTLENIIIGILAFIVGILLGIVLYQLFVSIIMNIFNQPYEITINLNLLAVGITAIYFFGIFLLVLFNSRRKIKKTKVYDLLYAEKKNENNIIKKSRGNVFLFVVSIVLLVTALLIIKDSFYNIEEETSATKVLSAIIMLIVGIYLFYISLSSFIVKRYLNNKKRKYKKDNMFLYRNLTSKINTISITMGTIALMFTIILIGGNVALLMNNMLNNEIDMGYPFEIMISTKDGDFSKYKKYIEENAKVIDMHEYQIYDIPNTGIHEALYDTIFDDRYFDDIDTVMSLTDYNRLREILGLEKLTLNDDEIIIQTMKTAENFFVEYVKDHPSVKIAGKDLKIKEVSGENLSQISFNGYTYCLVVPDSLMPSIIEESKKTEKSEFYDFNYKLVAQTENSTDEEFYNGLSDLIETQEITETYEYGGEVEEYTTEFSLATVNTRGARISETKSFFTIISFLAFYIALVFLMTTATLLAIQQLSDSEKYEYRYEILKKLGMDEQHINRLVIKQLLFYFMLPLVIPIIISIPVTIFVGHVFLIAVTMEEIIKNLVLVIGLVLLVYLIYFVATAVQFERNINGANW